MVVIDPSPVIACAAEWRPRTGWAEVLREPYAALVAGAKGLEASHAWSQVAMMMGDTRGAPLALVVCLHAAAELPDGVEDRLLSAHRDLCLLDLGLATAPGPVRIAELGEPGTIEDRPSELEAWVVRALVPFDGELGRAAWYALRLAVVRTGVIDGPEPEP
jgi:hypothetical protein